MEIVIRHSYSFIVSSINIRFNLNDIQHHLFDSNLYFINVPILLEFLKIIGYRRHMRRSKIISRISGIIANILIANNLIDDCLCV